MEEFYFGRYYDTDDIYMMVIRKFPADKGLRMHGVIMREEYIPCVTYTNDGERITFTYGKDAEKVFEALNESRIEDIKEEIKVLQEKYERAIIDRYTGDI